MTRGSGPLVLFRTPYFGGPISLEGVPQELQAHFTTDQTRLRDADAVVFHIPDWRMSQLADTPKYPGQLWILWSMESAVNYPRMADALFLRHFDLHLTYERKADVWSPYIPPVAHWEAAMALPLLDKSEEAPLVMFQSALVDGCGRNAFSRALMRQMEVDSYGRVFRTRKLAEDLGRQTKLETIARYRFCLSLENSVAPNYVTEKLYDPLMAGTVPVYRGAPDAADFAPEHSYIDAEAYGGPKGLADYLRHLMRNPDEYEAYLAWRRKPLPRWIGEKLDATARTHWLRLLDIVAERGNAQQRAKTTLPFGLRAALRARGKRAWHRLTGKPEAMVAFR